MYRTTELIEIRVGAQEHYNENCFVRSNIINRNIINTKVNSILIANVDHIDFPTSPRFLPANSQNGYNDTDLRVAHPGDVCGCLAIFRI